MDNLKSIIVAAVRLLKLKNDRPEYTGACSIGETDAYELLSNDPVTKSLIPTLHEGQIELARKLALFHVDLYSYSEPERTRTILKDSMLALKEYVPETFQVQYNVGEKIYNLEVNTFRYIRFLALTHSLTEPPEASVDIPISIGGKTHNIKSDELGLVDLTKEHPRYKSDHDDVLLGAILNKNQYPEIESIVDHYAFKAAVRKTFREIQGISPVCQFYQDVQSLGFAANQDEAFNHQYKALKELEPFLRETVGWGGEQEILSDVLSAVQEAHPDSSDILEKFSAQLVQDLKVVIGAGKHDKNLSRDLGKEYFDRLHRQFDLDSCLTHEETLEDWGQRCDKELDNMVSLATNKEPVPREKIVKRVSNNVIDFLRNLYEKAAN